ncbi:tafazzin-like [Paramacrobiotus metropolitanus]|uniref:tafazzin-like n=1 Tax=Paramacrobiotus metropolitanus TaxID=2943436 RepID=UPI0024460B7E|nr:tafazzin-like [Paramacrobiotus metropolitanus]
MDRVRWPFPDNPGKLWHAGSGLTIAAVASISKLVLALNGLQIHGRDRLKQVLDNRDPKRGLITVANHYCCADDPVIWGILPWRHLRPRRTRWSMGAAEICFATDATATFFGLGKVVPTVRGAGVYQRGMDFMLERLNLGEWVHVFPEARVNQEHQWLRMKWGVGRLIAECDPTPIVLPFFHQGLDTVQPNRPPYAPRFGKKVTVLIGNVIDYAEKVAQMRADDLSPRDQRHEITEDIQRVMKSLRYEAETIHAYR